MINIILRFFVFISLPWFWFYERFIYDETNGDELDDEEANITLELDGKKMIFQSIDELQRYINTL